MSEEFNAVMNLQDQLKQIQIQIAQEEQEINLLQSENVRLRHQLNNQNHQQTQELQTWQEKFLDIKLDIVDLQNAQKKAETSIGELNEQILKTEQKIEELKQSEKVTKLQNLKQQINKNQQQGGLDPEFVKQEISKWDLNTLKWAQSQIN